MLAESDLDITIWRYLTFPKFVSLLATQALWFSKLATLVDQEEGTLPAPARTLLETEHEQMAKWFPDNEDAQNQLRQGTNDNEKSGRELIVANSWFIGVKESQKMWGDYAAGSEGVVIRSTPRRLWGSLIGSREGWEMGKVQYVNPMTHTMTAYEATQAGSRAFLKNSRFEDECEFRIIAMNFVGYGCLNPDGSEPSEQQRAGFIYSEGRRGIFVKANLRGLLQEIRTAATATDWHHDLVNLLLSGLGMNASRSTL